MYYGKPDLGKTNKKWAMHLVVYKEAWTHYGVTIDTITCEKLL